MLSTIPFSGFYQSWHDELMNEAVGQMFTDRATGTDRNQPLEELMSDACEWGLVRANYCAYYVAALAEQFKIAMVFESVKSPREYNFETDVIYVTLEPDEALRLHKEVSPEALRATAASRHTSYSGFHSFYSPDTNDWGPVEGWDHNQMGTLLKAYIDENYLSGEFTAVEEMHLMEGASSEGHLENWISSATPIASRLFAIHDYLESRKERTNG